MLSLQFFNALFARPKDGADLGYVCLALFRDGKPDYHSYAWPSQAEDMVAFCVGNSTTDIYFVPALYSQPGAPKASNIKHQWVTYADVDNLDFRKLRVEPSIIVETSPGRFHLYWVTPANNDVKSLIQVGKSIAAVHSDDGCNRGAWDAGQLLRVPGTTNNKDEEYPHEVRIVRSGRTYPLAYLQEFYPETIPSDRPSSGGEEMPPKDEWLYEPSAVAESSTIFQYHTKIYDLYRNPIKENQNLSESLSLLLQEMSKAGVTKKTAMYIAWEAQCNPYRSTNDMEGLWRELCRAYADPANQAVTNSLEADTSTVAKAERSVIDAAAANPENQIRKIVAETDILTEEERRQVPNDTFVDRYVNWAATTTDAPHIYHRAGAMMIMSAVYGEFGCCPTAQKDNLTVWFLLLGPSTRARKSTSMYLWRDLVADLQDERFPYPIEADVTAEALSIDLPRRHGRSFLFLRDEADGLLYEQEKKRHLAGLREYLTELFGGRVRGRLRVSTLVTPDGKIKEEEGPSGNTRTNFLTFLCGTLVKVTDALSISDYQSGFLARFLVAEADPPPLTRESMYIPQFFGGGNTEDLVRTGLLQEIRGARNHWMSKVKGFGNPQIIPFEPEVWERYRDACFDMYEMAAKHELRDALEPTAQRMGVYVMKASVMLAMSERKDKVEMRHLLKALSMMEEWYTSTVKIAGRILHSAWQARQEEMLSIIGSRMDGITERELYSRVRTKMQEREIESHLNLLTKSGAISKEQANGRIRYVRIPHG